MSDKFKPQDRYRLYLFNTITGERVDALAKNHSILSLAEARKGVKTFSGNFSAKGLIEGWVYRYEKM